MSEDLKFLIDVVRNASFLINDELKVKAKDDKGDVVTNFDYAIENYIIGRINNEYPEFSIISEEYNNKNELTENCFTIDPIDGTINFANGIPLWGIQVACIKNYKTCAAVIYLPQLDEFYYADENGAFMNDKPISVNKTGINKGIYTIEGPEKFNIINKIFPINKNVRFFWCSAVNYTWIASGKISAACYIGENLWDYVPGQYIVEKAGGVIYNSKRTHIAVNNEAFLNLLKDNSPL